MEETMRASPRAVAPNSKVVRDITCSVMDSCADNATLACSNANA
jgi:hypothetical protein